MASSEESQEIAVRQSSDGVEQARAIQEVQASLVIANRFRRDPVKALNNILAACQRQAVAETAMFAFARKAKGDKNTTISGPTIKLIRLICQHWGNIEFGTRESPSGEGSTSVECFCWDKETNVREVRGILVRHERRANNAVHKLYDPRDIAEHVSSQAQRKVRECVKAVIPAYVVQEAEDACKATLAGDKKIPLIDRVRKIVMAFTQWGVNQEMIEARLGHPIDLTTGEEFVELHQIIIALKEGEQKREDFFTFKVETAVMDDLNAKFAPK